MLRWKRLMIGVLFVSGCGAERVTTATQEAAQQFRGVQKQYLDCTGPNSSRCADISEMISSLEEHSEYRCRMRGVAARARFDAPAGTAGFYLRDTQLTSHDAYVIMQPDATKPSEWGPTDNYTYIEPSLWQHGFSGRRGAIAHDEDHQTGIDNLAHTTGESATTTNRCS